MQRPIRVRIEYVYVRPTGRPLARHSVAEHCAGKVYTTTLGQLGLTRPPKTCSQVVENIGRKTLLNFLLFSHGEGLRTDPWQQVGTRIGLGSRLNI